jgi:hypothetical protein
MANSKPRLTLLSWNLARLRSPAPKDPGPLPHRPFTCLASSALGSFKPRLITKIDCIAIPRLREEKEKEKEKKKQRKKTRKSRERRKGRIRIGGNNSDEGQLYDYDSVNCMKTLNLSYVKYYEF